MSPRKPSRLPPVGALVTVRAAEGVRVPREGNPRRHITRAEPRQVRMSSYYRRIIRDGDLEVVKTAKSGGEQ